MDGQNVSPAEQFVFGHVDRTGFFRGFRCQVRAPRDDVHAERLAHPRHSRTDPAQTQHAQHRTAELPADRRLPATGTHRKTLVDDPASGGQDQRPGQLDRRLHVPAGGPDVDAVILGGRHVDRRIERPGGRDHLESWQSLDDAPRQWCALPHHADDVEWRQSLDEIALVSDVIGEHRDLGARSHLRPVGHAQRDVLVVVEDCDLHRANFAHQV